MLQCYKCDGVKGQDLPCDGASGKGKEVCTLYDQYLIYVL